MSNRRPPRIRCRAECQPRPSGTTLGLVERRRHDAIAIDIPGRDDALAALGPLYERTEGEVVAREQVHRHCRRALNETDARLATSAPSAALVLRRDPGQPETRPEQERPRGR